MLPFFWSRALKSSFLLDDFPVPPAAAGHSLAGEPEVFTGEWALGRLLKVSPGSFRPRTFLFDLSTTERGGGSSPGASPAVAALVLPGQKDNPGDGSGMLCVPLG